MRAFIAMPFENNFNPHWEIIKKTCSKFKIDVFRVDKNLSYERNIDIAIRKEIEKSDFMIAILTGDKVKTIPNANVAFEVGYAQGIGKEVILLAESVDCLPFDFKQQRTGLYEENPDKIEEYLTEEVKLLKDSISKKYIEQITGFFKEIERCLNIVLPSEFRFFNCTRGFIEGEIWYGISYFKTNYFLRYVVSISDEIEKVKLYVWMQEKEYIKDQKNYAKKHYDDIRRYLGYDTNINFELHEEKENLKDWAKSRNFIQEVLVFEKQTFSTNEALKISLRLRDYVQALQPIFLTFVKEKGLEEILLK